MRALLQFGTIIGNFTAGLMMHHFRTWRVGFYAFGGINLVIGLLYVSLDSFTKHSEVALGCQGIQQFQLSNYFIKKFDYSGSLT